MKFKEFEQYISVIATARDRGLAIERVFNVEGSITMFDELIDSIVLLLEQIFHDHERWVAYWLWELDFGTNYVEGSVLFNKKPVPLRTVRDLYNVLVKD